MGYQYQFHCTLDCSADGERRNIYFKFVVFDLLSTKRLYVDYLAKVQYIIDDAKQIRAGCLDCL